jgi:hypothetical protein
MQSGSHGINPPFDYIVKWAPERLFVERLLRLVQPEATRLRERAAVQRGQ